MLFSNNLDQYSLGPSSIKFAIEDLLPRAEVQFAGGDGDDHFAPHDLAFHVGIGIVLAGAVVGIPLRRCIEGCDLFEPLFVVLVQSGFVVVDKYACCDVHRVAQNETFTDSARPYDPLNFGRDVLKGHAGRQVKSQVFGFRFHAGTYEGEAGCVCHATVPFGWPQPPTDRAKG